MPRRENAKGRILDAAEELVAEKGIDALNMDTIAMMTGLGKGGVLYHFRYKVDLMQGLIERYFQQVHEVLQVDKDAEDANAWLDRYIEFIFKNKGDRHRSIVSIFAAASRYPQLMEPVREFYEYRQREILNKTSDPRLAAILVLATDGYGLFSDLSLPPIADSDIEGVEARTREMLKAMAPTEQS